MKFRISPLKERFKKKKISLKRITVAIIIAAGIGGYFVFQKPSFSETRENTQLSQRQIDRSMPFGMHTGITRPFMEPDEKPSLSGFHYNDAINIGLGWERPGMYASHPLNTKLMDVIYGDIPKGINIIANIETPRKKGTFKLRVSEQTYVNFVKQLTERYDGDGIDDMPGLKNPIKHWQIDNEPPVWQFGMNDKLPPAALAEWMRSARDDYAHILEIADNAIKSACSDCKTIIGGMISEFPDVFQEFFKPILKKLNGKHIDVFDFHLFGNNEDGYKKSKPIYETIHKALDDYGYKNTEIWILETGTPSGSPVDEVTGQPYPGLAILEKDQAGNLIKRLIYPLTFGVKKTLWAWAMVEGTSPIDNNDVFDNTGLIYDGIGTNDPGYGIKKLSYYTYKKMVEILEGSDWNNIQTIQESDGIYIYEFTKNGKPIWVAWNDNSQEKQITISGISTSQAKTTEAVPEYETGKDVKDYNTAFNTEIKTVTAGKVTVSAGKSPVFVEEK